MPLTAHHPTQELIDIVGALGGTWHGHTAMCRCPAHSDRTPSLSLRQGDHGILVTCFAGCRREDVLRELRRVPPCDSYPTPPNPPSRGRANIERLWEEAGPAGSALPWKYLLSRGFDCVPADLRFHPRCPHGPKPHTVFKPAILVAVREGRQLKAVQRIFLDPATGRHADKVMLGRLGGGAWKGRAASTILGLAEGFESAEAYAQLHNQPCWGTLGARRLDQIILPDMVEDLVLAGDNDFEGRRAVDRATERYGRPGLCIRPDFPPASFKDWAEVLEHHRKRGRGQRQ